MPGFEPKLLLRLVDEHVITAVSRRFFDAVFLRCYIYKYG